MRAIALLAGLLCCGGVMLDAFQTIILPRRPVGRFRITRFFYRITWKPWVWLAKRTSGDRQRDQFFSVFGPMSLLFLLVLWAVMLTVGFALLFFAMGTPFLDAGAGTGHHWWTQLRTDGYVSGTTLTTLGPGDVVPRKHAARWLMIVESGTGLGFVAMVIGYIPVLYQAFSRREVSVALLDARAGSPPTASEMLRRHAFDGGQAALIALLAEWERWAAELLESHISYPILCYYRSQHDNQSWLAALTAVLDACALLIATTLGPEGQDAARQAQLTFALGRHALIDLGHVFHLESEEERWVAQGDTGRLTPELYRQLCAAAGEVQIRLCGDPSTEERLRALRLLYEPSAMALASFLQMSLPKWIAESHKNDPWRKVAALRSQPDVLTSAEHISRQSAVVYFGDVDHG